MKISCSDCRAQLGELIDSEVTGETAATTDLRARVADCADCQRDLALMRAARNELRSFPVLAAPSDLRERVRAQIAAAPSTPVAAAIENRANTQSPAGNKNRTLPVSGNDLLKNKRRDFRSRAHHLIDFLQRPSNVAWSSSFAIALFCIVLLVRPQQQKLVVLPSEVPSSQRYYGEGPEGSGAESSPKSTTAKTAKPKVLSPVTKVPVKISPPQSALPGQTPAPFLPPMSGAPRIIPGSNSDDASSLPAVAPPMQGDPAVSTGGNAKNKANENLNSGSTLRQSPAPATPAAPSVTAPSVTAPSVTAPSADLSSSNLPSSARARKENSGAIAAINGNQSRAPIETAPDGGQREVQQNPVARANSKTQVPAPMMESRAADSDNPGGVANRAAAKSSGKTTDERATSSSASSAESATVSRRVTARISAPRDVDWGQVSVVLPEGVRFADGGKARVLWRGAASAGDNIEVSFNVVAAPGSHAIRVSLQEVRKGEAETLARDSVSVSGR